MPKAKQSHPSCWMRRKVGRTVLVLEVGVIFVFAACAVINRQVQFGGLVMKKCTVFGGCISLGVLSPKQAVAIEV